MAGYITLTAEQSALDALLAGTLYVQLDTTAGDGSTAGTAVPSTNGAARFAITFTDASPGKEPAADASSPWSTGAWASSASIGYASIWTAASGGTRLFAFTLSSPVTIDAANKRVTIRTTDLLIRIPPSP
jgi:hypothetical protein